MNLDPFLGANQGNLPPEPGFGPYNDFSHSQNQQTLGSDTPTSYDKSFWSGHVTRRNPAQNETPVTASHLTDGRIQDSVQEYYHPPQTHARLLDNNLQNDSGGMERGGNRTRMSENYSVDSGIPIDPRLHRTGLAGAPSQEQLFSRAKEAARSLSMGHGDNQQYGSPMPFHPVVPTPNWPSGAPHGQIQPVGMGGAVPHPSQITPDRPAYQFPTQNVYVLSLSPNSFPPGTMIPTTSPANPHQRHLPTVPTVSAPVNTHPTPSASVSQGGRLLKISRRPHRPYTEDDFKGIRIGGKRMTHKVPGEWNAETKANHYPFFLAYHGRPKYQAAEDKHENYLKRSAEARALSPNDKVLLLDFIKANKYWCKHKKLPNPPNVQFVNAGSDGNESDVEDELPDPDETNGEEEEMSNSGIQTSLQETTALGKRLNQVGSDATGIPLVQASHDAKEFVNFQRLNAFLIRESLPSLLDLANRHLESIGRPKVRLSNKSDLVFSSSPSNSSAPGEITQFVSQNYNSPNTNFIISDNGVSDYGPTSDTASQHKLTRCSPEGFTTTTPEDSLSAVPQSVKSGKRKAVENVLHRMVDEGSVPAAKKVRSSSDFMGQVANSNAQHQNHDKSGDPSPSILEGDKFMNDLIATHGFAAVLAASHASELQDHPTSVGNLARVNQHISAHSWTDDNSPAVESSNVAASPVHGFGAQASRPECPDFCVGANQYDASTVGRPCPFQQDDAAVESEGYIEFGPRSGIDDFINNWEQGSMADPSGNNDSSY